MSLSLRSQNHPPFLSLLTPTQITPAAIDFLGSNKQLDLEACRWCSFSSSFFPLRRGWQAFSVKGQTVNIRGFAGQTLPITTKFCPGSTKAAQTTGKGRSTALLQSNLTRTSGSWTWPTGCVLLSSPCSEQTNPISVFLGGYTKRPPPSLSHHLQCAGGHLGSSTHPKCLCGFPNQRCENIHETCLFLS